jgi:hypothetical protein
MDEIFRVFSVPADGISAATEGNGDFGTSPIFGQLSDKPGLACIDQLVLPHLEHNSEAKK